MKKQILFVFTAILSLALASCQSNPENIEIKESPQEVSEQISEQILDVQPVTNKTFEELKREAHEATRKAKERIRLMDSSKESIQTFEELKKEAEEANQRAEN